MGREKEFINIGKKKVRNECTGGGGLSALSRVIEGVGKACGGGDQGFPVVELGGVGSMF